MSFLLNFAIAFLTFLFGLYVYINWTFTYWKRRGLPHHKSNFPLGLYKLNINHVSHFSEIIKEQYDYFKGLGHKHFGIQLCTRPVYIPIHPELIRNMMIKDFKYFTNRGLYYNEKDDPVNAHLITMEDEKWKDMREKISPIFTTNKIKMVMETFLDCSSRMVSTINALVKNEDPIDMKEISGCYSTDVIGSCVFGIDCCSFKGDQNEFRKHARDFFSPQTLLESFKWLIAFSNVKLGRFLKISLTSKNITNFFLRVVQDNVQFRERTYFSRPDLMQLLINLKNNKLEDSFTPNKADNQQNLTMLELTAECFLFFNAGIQTSASTITFCLYELTKYLDIQEKLRNEINDAIDKNNGKFTYDNLNGIKYLHQVVEEILRMYPPLYMIPRQCSENYQVPNSTITIEKGTLVIFPVSALQRDSEFFPEPDKFDPERFNKTNKATICPSSYLPFGDGPRVCIAMRFGLMQIKLGIANLLRHFRFTLHTKSTNLKLDAKMPMLSFEGPVWFNIEKINSEK